MKGVELFQKGSVHEFYRLKALITLEQVNTSVVNLCKLLLYANASGDEHVAYFRR